MKSLIDIGQRRQLYLVMPGHYCGTSQALVRSIHAERIIPEFLMNESAIEFIGKNVWPGFNSETWATCIFVDSSWKITASAIASALCQTRNQRVCEA